MKYGSVEPLTPAQSDQVRARVDHRRTLPSRYLYRDKNATLRSKDPVLPVKAKARLTVGGHLDPRLAEGQLRTDAPTITRTLTLLFLILCERYLFDIVAGDVEAAVMQGDAQHGDQ